MNECGYCKNPIPDNQRFCSEKSGTKCRQKFWTDARRIGAGKISALLAQASSNDEPQSMSAFFNTIKLEGAQLTAARENANAQRIEILNFFKTNVGMYTPYEVAAHYPQWPITSVRRSITNLTKMGALRKTAVKRTGAYGVDNYCWCVA